MRIVTPLLALLAGIAALLGLRRLFGARETVDWRKAERPGRIEQVDGVGLHVVERGSGPAVILLHGFGGHTYSFRYTIPALAKTRRVIAVDLKGFGYSERPPESDYSQGAQARLVVALMDRLGVEKAALVGHSLGGGVAMRVAAGWPERVERLALAASVPGDRFRWLLPPATPLLKPFLPLFSRIVSRRLLSISVYDRSFLTEEVRDCYRAPLRLRGSMRGLYQMIRDARKDKPIDFGRITMPVRILWGERERVLPRWFRDRLRKRLPQSKTVTIARAGHLLLEERPDECNAALMEFLGAAPTAEELPAHAPAEA